MRLLAKYNRINVAATIAIFLAGSCTFYILLRYILIHQLDDSLKSEQQEVLQQVAQSHKLPVIINTKDQYMTYENVSGTIKPSFKSGYENYYGKQRSYRELIFGVKVDSGFFLVTVSKPLEETEDLLQVIISVTICMVALILLVGYLINRSVLNKIWQPFYQTIDNVKQYNLTAHDVLKLPWTNIDEFSLLNENINNLTERIQKDYQSLKVFTGHAAHEMQTPLAVIRSKLDMISQDESITKQTRQSLIDIERAVQKLSRLYQSLLLLTKIENKQFVLNELVPLDKIIEDKCSNIADLLDARDLHLKLDLVPVTINFHHLLAEVIVDNLLGNALKYNIEGGSIEIVLRHNSLLVANTSYLPQLDNNKVFSRFYRHTDVMAEGTGLGLSIVKQICELAVYMIDYQYDNDRHIFCIHF